MKKEVFEEKVEKTTWCLSCSGYTFNRDGHIKLTKTGRPRLASLCKVCGKGKSRMLPPFPKGFSIK